MAKWEVLLLAKPFSNPHSKKREKERERGFQKNNQKIKEKGGKKNPKKKKEKKNQNKLKILECNPYAWYSPWLCQIWELFWQNSWQKIKRLANKTY